MIKYKNEFFNSYCYVYMKAGKNGDINTIYNVGKMEKVQKNRSNSINRGFKDPNGNNTASSRIPSINSIQPSNENVNTTLYYIKEI